MLVFLHMQSNTILVLSDPTDPQLKMLQNLPDETGIVVGNSVEAFERTASSATVIFSWSIAGPLLRDVFPCATTYSGCTAEVRDSTECFRPR